MVTMQNVHLYSIFFDESSFLVARKPSSNLTETDLVFGVLHSRMPAPVIIEKWYYIVWWAGGLDLDYKSVERMTHTVKLNLNIAKQYSLMGRWTHSYYLTSCLWSPQVIQIIKTVMAALNVHTRQFSENKNSVLMLSQPRTLRFMSCSNRLQFQIYA